MCYGGVFLFVSYLVCQARRTFLLSGITYVRLVIDPCLSQTRVKIFVVPRTALGDSVLQHWETVREVDRRHCMGSEILIYV